MAFELSDNRNEIKIFDERTGSVQSLFARDPTPREQLAYQNEKVYNQSGKVHNRLYQTRLKFACLLLEEAQGADTPGDEGYGFRNGETWVPLTAEVESVPFAAEEVQADYGQAFGADWAGWISGLAPWQLLLLAKVPAHLERVASVVFEGAADYKQILAQQQARLVEDSEGEDSEGN